MIVTFISQCEKKAIKRTNRVLDAYANRIGDRTWQTVITQEGLDMVKKLLKKNASKNTAVSCHKIRGRALTKLLWTVGNKRKFNSEGVVPVNYKNKIEDSKDEKNIMNKKVYANTQKQLLTHHLFGVGYVAALITDRLVDVDHSNLCTVAYVAGCLHDIGKLDKEYRLWIESKIKNDKDLELEIPENGLHIDKAKFSFDNHPRHNEISLWISSFSNLDSLLDNKRIKHLIEHVIYWHHAKPIRKEEYTKLNDIHRKLKSLYTEKELAQLFVDSEDILSEVEEIAKEYKIKKPDFNIKEIEIKYDDEIVEGLNKIFLPSYKEYEVEESIVDYKKYIILNSKLNILRSSVISADRLISSLSAKQLSEYITNGKLEQLVEYAFKKDSKLISEVKSCLLGFEQRYPKSERNIAQSKAASSLFNVNDVAILNGPAGCGKTKISLEWAVLNNAKRIIWICPRIQVCEGLFEDLTSDDYLPNAKIEIYTSELKYTNQQGVRSSTLPEEELTGDIVLTTIDQIINSITTHSNVTAFINYLDCHVIFDEFHEYIPMAGFNLLFAELVRAKKMMEKKSNTLLVSATPNYLYVNSLLEIDTENIIDFISFNESDYKMKFELYDETEQNDKNPLYKKQEKNTIVISNTATTAQLAFIQGQQSENAIVFHGKFKTIDKQNVFGKVYQSFKQFGSKKYDVLRSGPIVQAALNITCSFMTTEMTVAENFLQRLGRLDRFGTSNNTNILTLAIPIEIANSNGKIKGNCARFLYNSNTYRGAYTWYEFLKANLDEKTVRINTIYDLYKQYYNTESCIEAVRTDIIASLKDSAKTILSKVHDPIQYSSKKAASVKKRIKKSSLRGDSRFVQMAIAKVKSLDEFVITNDYAVDWQDSDVDFSRCYTESLAIIRDSGLLDYVSQKHGRIDPKSPISKIAAKNYRLRKQILEAAAVEADNCIYLSYIPRDLDEKLNEQSPHESAIYYVHGVTQIIGAMPFNKINNSKD